MCRSRDFRALLGELLVKTPRNVAIALLVMLAAMVPPACDMGRDSAVGSRALELNAFVTAADLAVGVNRFPFVLVDTNGEAAVGASVRAKFARLGEDGASTVKSSGEAVFVSVTSEFLHVHEDGFEHIHEHVEGVYVVNGVDFDEPGFWEADFEVKREGIGTTMASAAFEVRERPIAPGVGRNGSGQPQSDGSGRGGLVRNQHASVAACRFVSIDDRRGAGAAQAACRRVLYARILRQPGLRTGDGPCRVAVRRLWRPDQLHPHRAVGARNCPWRGEGWF